MAELWESCQRAGRVSDYIVREGVRVIAYELTGQGVINISPEELMTRIYHTNVDNNQVSIDNNNSVHFEEHSIDEFVDSGELACVGTS